MKDMYAIKCLYKSNFYGQDDKLIEDACPQWEERIVLIKAKSLEDADLESEKIAKSYEYDYVNIYQEKVKVRLYAVIDIFATFDTDDRTNIEVYSNIFEASEEDVEKVLDVLYPIDT